MCTPVGHSMFGMIIYYAFNGRWLEKFDDIRWKTLGLYIVLANLPDLDFIPGIMMGNPNLWHHVISHSFLFLMLVGVLISSWWELATSWYRRFLTAMTLLFGHTIIDYFTVDTRPPFGIDLFWPMEGYFIAPKPIFPTFHREMSQIISVDNLLTLLVEFNIFISILIATYFILNWKTVFRKKVEKESELFD